ncbi:hypothetical protein [Nocardia alni]|uniref:hypothetical protein n=1 Tax=Nocardia alni TaxID=2815723 RepID=UPI001C248B14|nr:hypothetical protein [Nocardia alni]
MATPQPISRRSALDAGLSDSDLRRLCRIGTWHRIRTGHYVTVPAAALTPAERHRALLRATLDAVADTAVVSHVSALIGHGLPAWGIRLDRAHLTRPRRTGARVGRVLVVHAGQLAPDEIIVIDGVRSTTVERTLVDIARTEQFAAAVAVGDAALHRGATTAERLREQLHRARARPGYHRAAAVVAFLDGRSSNTAESRLRVALSAAGLPAPEPKAQVLSPDNTFVARVDLLLPTLGVAADFDPAGRGGLGARTDPARADPRTEAVERALIAAELREDRLRSLGWIPIRWTWGELEDPREVPRRIEAAAASRTRSGRWLPCPRA